MRVIIICIMSENASGADNQQERLQESYDSMIGYYLAGFVDGEGSFNVSLRKRADYRIGWQVVLSFNVSQRDITVLNILKDTLRCGIIKTRKCDGLHSYDVTKPKDIINRVIPYFDKFHFFSPRKQRNYEIFKIISYLSGKRPLDKKTLLEIVSLREILNQGKGRTRKYSINDVFEESPETICQAPLRRG